MKNISDTIRQGFVTGVILIAPLAITLFVIEIIYGWLVGMIQPFLQVVPANTSPLVEPLALILLFIAITIVGIIVRQGIGDEVIMTFDRFMETIPVVSTIYSSARQASTALAMQEDQFERVAIVEWPRTGLQTIGFITSETSEKVHDELPEAEQDDVYYDVFVPMVPNPMGGFLAVVPEQQITMTDLSLSEGFQILVTTGMSGDERFSADQFVNST
ncbi:MAG: DUF502 domain-containing protein [Halobacteriaceae archaeon]